MERPEIVWLGRDNPVARELLADGAPLLLTNIGRHTLTLSGTGTVQVIDSALTPDAFVQVDAVLHLRLGSIALPPGRHSAVLTVFTAEYPNGLLFPAFPIEVRTP